MVNAMKFNKNVHKLSKIEKNVYYELQKYLNKDQDINVLIGSYLAGNNSKDLFNKIDKIYMINIKIIKLIKKNILIYFQKLIKCKIYGNNS